MDMLKYSYELEMEINLMSAMIYAKLEEDGYWRKKIFHIETLTSTFKTGKANMYRQLNYLREHGYIEYVKPYENKSGTIKTLKILQNDRVVDMDSLDKLPKFHANKIKILTSLAIDVTATTKDITFRVLELPRSTISRLLLELQRDNVIYSYCKIPHKLVPNVMENIWRLV